MRYVTILTSPRLSASRMMRHNATRASPGPGAAAGGAHACGTAVDARISEGVSEIDAEVRAALTELGQQEKSQPKEEWGRSPLRRHPNGETGATDKAVNGELAWLR